MEGSDLQTGEVARSADSRGLREKWMDSRDLKK